MQSIRRFTTMAISLPLAALLTFGCQTSDTPSGIDNESAQRVPIVEPAQAGIDIEKATNGHDADFAPGPTILNGEPVQWTYVVTNVGQVRLDDVTVTDDQGVAVSCPKSNLEPGESMTCTGQGIAVPGQYSNIGTATGTATGPGATGYARQEVVQDDDPSHYFSPEPEPPGIDIEKATNGHDADSAPGPTIPDGDPVEWTYVVTNTGPVPLTDVTVTDDQGVAVSCPKNSLQPGESMTCTGHGNAQQGQYSNVGTATGMTPDGNVVQDDDRSHYYTDPGEPVGEEGCSHGYWKNHTGAWTPTGLAPDMSVESVFADAAAFLEIGTSSLIDALRFKGGRGVEGGARILLRQAVAAMLNAKHPDLAYPRTSDSVVADVNAALEGGDRSQMLQLAEELDHDNNLGCDL